MMWQLYETQNQSAVLDDSMADKLTDYLAVKESQLSFRLVELILQIEGVLTLPESMAPSSLKLNESVEEFGRKVTWAGQSSKKKPDERQWKVAAQRVNDLCWDYLELLEGCVVELFQQLDQIGFENWNVDLIRAATAIKDELNQRLDDLSWAIKRLEQQLKIYRRDCEARQGQNVWWRAMLRPFSHMLDSALGPTILKCSKYLNFRYRKFIERYAGYLQMYEGVQRKLDGLYDYRVLSSMDIYQQDKIKQLCFYLELWQQNNESRVLPRSEPVRALRCSLTIDRAASLFNEYHAALRKAVFDKSRLIKKQFRHIFIDKRSREPLLDNLDGYRTEIHFLNSLIARFRHFVQHTGQGTKSNKAGFFARLFGSEKESRPLRDLQKLSSQLKGLEGQTARFHVELKNEPVEGEKLTPAFKEEMSRHMHEMGQPLASQDLMHRHSKALTTGLQKLDEVASFDPDVVKYICRTLTKALCRDWRYHTLQSLPSYHDVYATHTNIVDLSGDRQHQLRLGRFQRLLAQIDGWLKNREMGSRTHEVELDINDIKAYLQDYLASVQRLVNDSSITFEDGISINNEVERSAECFLQYMQQFGTFFSKLDLKDPEHRLLRRQLLFVDQYFEEIDRKFHELGIDN